MLGNLYRRFKINLNRLADGGIRTCNRVLMNTLRMPSPTLQGIAQRIARVIGDLCWLVIQFPRLDVYRMPGSEWVVIYAGSQRGLRELKYLIFGGDVEAEMIGRVPLWKLQQWSQNWLKDEANLVICESGRIHPGRPKSRLMFLMPCEINQVVNTLQEKQIMLSGQDRKSLRQKIHKAEHAGFSYRFSQAETDLQDFYLRIYRPYILSRHGERAFIGTLDSQRRSWFRHGGLILVTLKEEVIGGTICYAAYDTVFDIEGGYLHTDKRLEHHGVNAFINWCVIDWAVKQGLKRYNLGISNAWRSDSTFTFKRRWGADVTRSLLIHPTWVFLMDNPPEALIAHLNKQGLVSENQGGFYSVLLQPRLSDEEMQAAVARSRSEGLQGIAVIQADAQPFLMS